jgi:hypothetical protein
MHSDLLLQVFDFYLNLCSFFFFLVRVSLFAWASLGPWPSSKLYLQNSWDHRYIPSHPAICWDGVLLTFCLSWWKTIILLISAWVAGITDLSR